MRADRNVEKAAHTPKNKKVLVLIVGIIFAVLLSFIAFFVIPNFGNIKAAWIWLTSTKEDIEVKLSENKQQQADAMVNAGLAGASAEVIDALNKGEITQEQFQQILLGRMTLQEARSIDDETSEVLDVKEDAVSALENGKISNSQFVDIEKGIITLEQALADNEKANKNPSQTTNPVESVEQTTQKDEDKTNNPATPPAFSDNPQIEAKSNFLHVSIALFGNLFINTSLPPC